MKIVTSVRRSTITWVFRQEIWYAAHTGKTTTPQVNEFNRQTILAQDQITLTLGTALFGEQLSIKDRIDRDIRTIQHP